MPVNGHLPGERNLRYAADRPEGGLLISTLRETLLPGLDSRSEFADPVSMFSRLALPRQRIRPELEPDRLAGGPLPALHVEGGAGADGGLETAPLSSRRWGRRCGRPATWCRTPSGRGTRSRPTPAMAFALRMRNRFRSAADATPPQSGRAAAREPATRLGLFAAVLGSAGPCACGNERGGQRHRRFH